MIARTSGNHAAAVERRRTKKDVRTLLGMSDDEPILAVKNTLREENACRFLVEF